MKHFPSLNLNNQENVISRLFNRLALNTRIAFLGLKTFSNWHKLLAIAIASRIRQDSSIITLQTWKGCKFKLRLEDVGSVNEVWLFKEYFPKHFKLPDHAKVADIGASIGLFTLYIANSYRDARIFAYEPIPENFSLQNDNIFINHYNNRVTSYNVAISSTRGKRTFLCDNTRHHGSGFFGKNGVGVVVKTITLEDIIDDVGEVDFLKMDVEGAEFEVLLNVKRSVLSKIKAIGLEYHDDLTVHNHVELCELLKDNGFETQLMERGTSGIIFASKPKHGGKLSRK